MTLAQIDAVAINNTLWVVPALVIASVVLAFWLINYLFD